MKNLKNAITKIVMLGGIALLLAGFVPTAVLAGETNGDTATAETDGFSLYTVEFTYHDLQYVMPGDSEVALSEILNKVSLTGEVTKVEVSSPELFSAHKNDSGEWIVTAHKAFSSEEWMKVTINDKEYKITVTDDLDTMSFADLQALIDGAADGG
nr:hypothetical protein [Lachnospiraceae bacterium]